MDTESFFRRILPFGGLKILAELVEVKGRPKPGWRYTTFESLAAMAEAVHQIDATGRTIYHACNGFGDWYEEDDKRRLRTQKNVVACRSLFDDLDVGKPGAYTSKKDAAQDVARFTKAVGLPMPLIVQSGAGIHLYWPLQDDVTPDEWRRLSGLKRLAAKHYGLRTDKAVDMDEARVLRPVGSTWRKVGNIPVRVVLDNGPYTVEQIEKPLLEYVAKSGVGELTVATPRDFGPLAVSTDLSAKDYPPSSLVAVSKHCVQVRFMRDSRGDVGYEHWRGVVGLARYCTEGLPLAEEWSSRRAETGHSQTDTDNKFNTWTTPPPTCEFFKSCNPTGCDGCPSNGKIKSPISLGYTGESEVPKLTIQPEATQATQPTSENSKEPEPASTASDPIEPSHWPDGYRVIAGALAAFTKDEDEEGAGKWSPFARPLFYPLERVRLEDKTYGLRMVMQPKEGAQMREFTIPTKALADARTMRTALGAYEITISNDKLATRYMHDYLSQLRRETEERRTYQQFGWNADFTGFLIGDRLITADEVIQVQVGDAILRAETCSKAYNLKGTKERWTRDVNKLYDQPNGEPYQYTICSVFGSVLAPIMQYNEWSGIPLALTSKDSGRGKTTAATIAVNALCDTQFTKVSNTTPQAILKRASNLNNLCGLFDDSISGADFGKRNAVGVAKLSDILYALSNGKGRTRLSSDGSERKPDPAWCLMSILTGNINVNSTLARSGIDPEAAQMRVFEIDMDSYPPMPSMDKHNNSSLHSEYQDIAVKLSSEVATVLAEPYIQYVIKNRETIRKSLRDLVNQIIGRLGGSATRERFYAYHIACTIVGGTIAKRLGFIDFDITALFKWSLRHIKKLRSDSARNGPSIQDKFSAMLADLHGTLIVTKSFDALDSRMGKTELAMYPPRNPIAGRLVLGGDHERGKLFITVRAIHDWCVKNEIDPIYFRRELVNQGLVRSVSENEWSGKPISIAKGVPTIVIGNAQCMEFEFSAAQGYVDEFVAKTEGAQ